MDFEEAYDGSPSFDMKIILGDFNSKIGKRSIFFPTIGSHSVHNISSDNGILLINFALAKGMIIPSTWFPHKRIHKGMWRSPDGHTMNQIDHVLVDKRYATHVTDVRTKRGPNIDSDHFMVLTKIRAKIVHRKKKAKGIKNKVWK